MYNSDFDVIATHIYINIEKENIFYPYLYDWDTTFYRKEYINT